MTEPDNTFSRVEAAFDNLLTLEADERAAYLADLEGRDPEVAVQVQRLLDADAQADDTLANPIAAGLQSLSDNLADPWIGKVVGLWRLTSRLGSGGMGAVFVGQRDDGQYEHQAAVKVMATQLLGDRAIERFKSERQILARLSHPNIATLIDGGSTDLGLPFLVIERIFGAPIDVYCIENELSVRARLDLFLKVCAAVDYAHRNLVVHRDLKPSNILVTDDGEPKLLDFGIAKLLADDIHAVGAQQTQAGEAPLTPEYASPEQIRGEPISVATDIYALGVLLFRMMTGASPYPTENRTALELQQAVLTQEPKRPSVVAASSSMAATDARFPMPDPAAWSRKLSGDIDNIILECLKKDPATRYATVRDLSDDIRRHLTQRPVLATGASFAYRTKKLLQRHARPLVAAAAVLSIIATLTTTYTMRLSAERSRAQLAAREAEEVSDFLVDIFKNADPSARDGSPQSAIGLLREAERQIDELDDQPVLQRELRQVIAEAFTAIGDEASSIRLLEQNRGALEASPSADPLGLADIYHALSEAYRLNNQPTEAEASIRKALSLRDGVLPPDHEDIIRSLTRLSVNLADQQRKTEALPYLQEALARKLANGGKHDALSVDILGNTAHVLNDLGRYDDAEAAHNEVIPLSIAIDGPLHPNTLIRIMNKGRFERSMWRYADAVATFTDAIERAEQVWTPEKTQMATWYAARAHIRLPLGQFQEALADNQLSMQNAKVARGENADLFFFTRRRYAETLFHLGQWDEARSLHEANIEQAIALFGDDAADTNYYRLGLFDVALAQEEFQEAEAMLAARLQQANEGTLRPTLKVQAFLRAAELRSQQGQFQEAEAEFAKAQKAQIEAHGEGHPSELRILLKLAEHQLLLGNLAMAQTTAEKAERRAADILGPDNWHVGLAQLIQAQALSKRGEAAEAQRAAQQALARLTAVFPVDHPLVQEAAALAG